MIYINRLRKKKKLTYFLFTEIGLSGRKTEKTACRRAGLRVFVLSLIANVRSCLPLCLSSSFSLSLSSLKLNLLVQLSLFLLSSLVTSNTYSIFIFLLLFVHYNLLLSLQPPRYSNQKLSFEANKQQRSTDLSTFSHGVFFQPTLLGFFFASPPRGPLCFFSHSHFPFW